MRVAQGEAKAAAGACAPGAACGMFAAMAKIPSKNSALAPALGLLPDLLGYHLRRAQLAVFQDFAVTMNGADITPGQFGVLALIDANPGMSQTRLGRSLGIDRSTVVGVIDKLESQGLVERAAHPGDRRAHALKLSPQGTKRFRVLARKVRQHENRVAKALSARERQVLVGLLQRIEKGR